MTFVVTSACVGCKDTACVEVCPVDCFWEGPNTLVIDPDQCIDCALCVPACPTDAIYADTDLPEHLSDWLQINADRVNHPDYENITESKAALAEKSPYTDLEAIAVVMQEVQENT